MSQVKFFSNSLILIDDNEVEISSSLKNTRLSSQDLFTVPLHTRGTKKLLIFLDGVLQVPDRDYVDSNSDHVRLTDPIGIGRDFYAVLLKAGEDMDKKDCSISLVSNEF